jgi:hypothetical protein
MMACCTAGRLGDGGGPGRPALFFSPIRSIGLGEAQVLEVGAGHARHQRVAVQSGPGAALEVVEAEFLLHLLVSLLARPARLDRAGQRTPRCPGGKFER